MPKLNTILAAVFAASTVIMPANAGHSGNMYPGGTVHQSSAAQSQSSAYSALAGGITCTHHGQEVPCESVPGLADALRAQGRNDIADRLPQVPLQQAAPTYAAPAYAAPAQTYTQAPVQRSVRTISSGYAGQVIAAPQSVMTGGCQVQVPAQIVQAQRVYSAGGCGAGYPCGSYIPGPGPLRVVPCNQQVQYQPAPAPVPVPAYVSVHLSDGTVYALNGGVGKGIYGEFYGGGGTYIEGGARYSGVLNAAASQFTFRQRTTPTPKTRTPKPKMRYPKPHNRHPHPYKKGHGKHGGGHH